MMGPFDIVFEDPTDETDVFTASITIVDGKVKVSYSPELDDARKALRKYTTWGKKDLMDAGWKTATNEHGGFVYQRLRRFVRRDLTGESFNRLRQYPGLA